MIKGKVDGWRVDRLNAYRIHQSLVGEDALDIYSFHPLPFDDEINQGEDMDEDARVIELYEYAKNSGYFERKI